MHLNRNQQATEIGTLLKALRQFKGITRKSALGELLPILGEKAYDDAGILGVGSVKLVVSADGIVESLVRDDPWLAGFYSVVVNVNDVAAKGACPLGYAHVLSSSSSSIRRQIVQGIKHGIDKYSIKFLKGHTHPDTSYDAIDAVVVGVTQNALLSSTAKPNDSLIVAVDLDGIPGTKGWVRTFDSVLLKTNKQVLTRLEAIIQIAEKKLAHACRDISGPGMIGTIGMLCESSRVGATLAIENIPKPKDLDMLEWLMSYPSTGFVLATSATDECIKLLTEHGMTARAVGRITRKQIIQLSYQDQSETFMNLKSESIFGLHTHSAAPSKKEQIEVNELSVKDASQIQALLHKVWSNAYEYPENWRKKRILTEEEIRDEMLRGIHYFGIKKNRRLVGVYKALVTDYGLLGEHQTVDPDHRGLGIATAMYHQFIGFARQNNCKRAYVNILTNQTSSRRIVEKMGFKKKGPNYEQAKDMRVQMYEKNI